MARRIPSLNRLRAFEAAARHLSFKEGARELCVTQAAVSHQIKALEAELGEALFHRGTRKVALTREAETLARGLTQAFDAIAAATTAFTEERLAGRLRISAAPFYANRWLLPRLLKFQARHPEIDLRVDPSFHMVDFAVEDFEAAVRYGHGDWPDLACIPIHQDLVGPVVAPQHVSGRALPLAAAEVAALPLATSSDLNSDWSDWLAAAGVRKTELNLVEYSNSVYAFDAALSGNAVCLADIRTTAGDEAAGNLVRLHPLTVRRAKGIYLVFPRQGGGRLRAETFAAWMREEAESVPEPP